VSYTNTTTFFSDILDQIVLEPERKHLDVRARAKHLDARSWGQSLKFEYWLHSPGQN